MPEYLRKILKWKMSSITPNVVKATLARSGFRVTNRKINKNNQKIKFNY